LFGRNAHYRLQRLKRNVRLMLPCALAIGTVGCADSTDPKSAAAPAKVSAIAREDQVNTVQLTPAAEKRLGIQVGPVQVGKVKRMQTYGGEAMLRVGAAIVVSAPVGGTLQPPPGGPTQVGAAVHRDQPMFLLLPLLSPERGVLTPAERVRFAEARNTILQQRIDADGQVQQARVQIEAARIAFERADRLLRERAGTLRTVDEARAQLSLAEKQLAAAEARKQAVDNIRLDEDPGTLAPLVISCPQNGVVRSQQATIGEVVSAGAPLFEVIDCDQLWIRVAVFSEELNDIDLGAAAEITTISGKNQTARLMARPIVAPPSANPLASSVDLFYELDNVGRRFRPGERVTARLPMVGDRENRVIPCSAVVQDYHGGSWVYENPSAQTYVRRRVDVRYVVDAWAVLGPGPDAGAKVVTAGAMELFGTEFGFAK
jgi:RND family efflux transporter MFP subunit